MADPVTIEMKTAKDHIELEMGGVEIIDLMIAVADFVRHAKNRRDEQNARCLLMQLDRAAQSGTGRLSYNNEEDYQKAWDACTTPVEQTPL